MSVSEPVIVETHELKYRRGTRIIFDGVNIKMRKGKVTAVMGPSGSGKTTLLRLIGGQLLADEGKVLVKGQNVAELNRSQLYEIRKEMGMLFQSGALFTDLSVFENVAFPLREHTELPDVMIKDLVHMKLQAVGLRGAAGLRPSELSGGMARRVALARAIALDPDIIMFDEPFAGQDPISMGVLVQLIKLLNHALGMSTILVSHDVHETISIADYIYIISDGRVIGEGTSESITNSTNPWVQQFIHAHADGPVPFHYPAQAYAEALWGDETI